MSVLPLAFIKELIIQQTSNGTVIIIVKLRLSQFFIYIHRVAIYIFLANMVYTCIYFVCMFIGQTVFETNRQMVNFGQYMFVWCHQNRPNFEDNYIYRNKKKILNTWIFLIYRIYMYLHYNKCLVISWSNTEFSENENTGRK